MSAPDPAPFTASLREASQPAWDQATGHRFVEELVAGTLDPGAYRAYMLQDHAFLDGLAGLIGRAISQAPDLSAKARFAGFLSAVTGPENDHFERAFAHLGVPEGTWQAPAVGPVTRELLDLFDASGDHGTYADTLSVLLPVEWIYLTWAQTAATRPQDPLMAEWIELHDNPAFETFVLWMRDQLEALGPRLTQAHRARVRWRFQRAVALEVAFFDQAYRLAKEAR